MECSNFLISLALGSVFWTSKELSFIVVTVIKKNSSMKTISGRDAVETAGKSPSFFLANLAINFLFIN